MAIITLPTKFAFTRIPEFKLQRSSNTIRSKYTGQGQTIVFPFAVWFLKGTLVDYDGLEAGKIRSFLVQLDGQANTFRLPVPGFSKPMTGYSANAQLKTAAAARASSITIKSLTPLASVFAEGDYFTINDELKLVTQAVAANGAGEATVSFKPPLRKAAAVNDAIITQNPTCLMRALDDDIAKWGVSAPVRQSTPFEAVEAVEI